MKTAMRAYAYSFAFVLAFCCSILVSPAQADIKLKGAEWIDQGDWQLIQENLSAQQRAGLARFGPVFKYGGTQLTVYASGSKLRVDNAECISIQDLATGQLQVLNPTRQIYVDVLADAPDARGRTVSVQPTQKTRMILGHLARRYVVSIEEPDIVIEADVWAAADIPFKNIDPDVISVNPWMRSVWGKIKGAPLWMTFVFAQGSHSIKMNYVIQSISTKPLPAGTFAVPEGYQRFDPRGGGSSPEIAIPGQRQG